MRARLHISELFRKFAPLFVKIIKIIHNFYTHGKEKESLHLR